jgi:hypothetical protein
MPLSEEDRLRLENDALLRIVQSFANMRDDNPYVAHQIERARAALAEIKNRKKALKRRDELEQACFHVTNVAVDAKIRNPAIIISRFGKNDWEAYIEQFEDAEFIGVGTGNSPLEAVRDLLSATKSYAARCKSGLAKHRSV